MIKHVVCFKLKDNSFSIRADDKEFAVIELEESESPLSSNNIKDDITEDFANEITDNVVFVEDRKGHDKKYSLDCSKIKNELSWMPTVNFDAGLFNTVKWIKDNF